MAKVESRKDTQNVDMAIEMPLDYGRTRGKREENVVS